MTDVQENDHAVVTVDLEAEADAVWESLTTSEGLAEWFGDGSFVGDEPGDDLHVLDPVTGRPKSGIIERFEPAECLEYTWWPIGSPDEASRVAITLAPSETGTRLTVTERPLAPVMSVLTPRASTHLSISEPELANSARSGSKMWIEMGCGGASASAGQWEWRVAMLQVGCERRYGARREPGSEPGSEALGARRLVVVAGR